MKFSNKTFLIISPERWDHIHVSKHHYAIHLSSLGNAVYFLNPPTDKFHIRKTRYPNLHVVDHRPTFPGMRFLPDFMQKVLMRKRILKIQEIVGKKIDIFWSFDNSILYNFQACPPNSISICHIVDLNQDFQFEKAATTANICFGTSSFIVDKLKKSNSKSFFINHGVGHLPETQSVKWVQNFDKPLVIGYAGNLNIPYFDWELFAKLIDNNKDCDFHLVGPWSLDHRNSFLNGRSNVKWLGVVDSQELPDFYNSADILTVTYKADEHKEQLSNPHKFMEYLASGKVILSTYTDQYADLKDLIVMSDRDGEFLALFSTIKKSIKKFNSENLVNRRIAFASENSYFKQIERIEKILRDNL